MPAKSVRKRLFVKAVKPAAGSLLVGYARVSKGDELHRSGFAGGSNCQIG